MSKTYYHGTEKYKIATIKIYGLTPQPVPGFVRDIVGLSKGVYLAVERQFADDLASFHYDEPTVIEVTVPDESKLIVDPELDEEPGEPPAGFIYPETIPPEYLTFQE